MDKISDFFQSIVLNQQPSQAAVHSGCGIKRFTKKNLCVTFQMLGIMLTLVGANILTSKISNEIFINVKVDIFLSQNEKSFRNM